MTKKIICFDLDNVIVKTIKNDYKNSKPIKKNIKFINTLYEKNFYIKIFTSRYMGRNKQNCKKVMKKFKITEKFLKENCNLKFNELIMCKPSYDIFVDDKAFGFKRNWSDKLRKLLL
tara:strand:+ start:4066 stop:4416 length:351 start_codon:yes stop_codon:yes gene_type:complete